MIKGILIILGLTLGIIGVGILVGWIFNSVLAGFITIAVLITLWAFWWLIRKLWTKEE